MPMEKTGAIDARPARRLFGKPAGVRFGLHGAKPDFYEAAAADRWAKKSGAGFDSCPAKKSIELSLELCASALQTQQPRKTAQHHQAG